MDDTHRIRTGKRRAGHSLVELMVCMLLLAGFLAAVFGALTDAMRAYDTQKTYALMQTDARKALERVGRELRTTGHIPNDAPGQPNYPYTFVNGAAHGVYNHPNRHDPSEQHVPEGTPGFGDCIEIVFRVPADIDGDGLLTSSATGNIEWGEPDVAYVLVTAAGGINELQRWEDGARTETVAAYVERITFDTIATDPSIAMDEVVVTVYMARPAQSGRWLQAQLSTAVKMRNTDGVVPPAPSEM